MRHTALILAVQPDSAQARQLMHALHERMNAEVVVVDTTDAALSVIDKRIPDVILLHALMLPAEEDYLIAYLRTLRNTDHVQTITVPQLESSSDCDRPKPSLFRSLKQRSARMSAVGCDSRLFAADVVGYLTRAREIQQQIHELKAHDQPRGASDRRGGHRWSPREMPWISSVRLVAGEQAELINVSASGALVRTYVRPALPSLKQLDLDSRVRSGLAFQLVTGAEVRATGRVVRCHVGSVGADPIQYHVAFRFDESIGLDLPTPMPPGAVDNVVSLSVREMPLQTRAQRVQEILNHSMTFQNELLARLMGVGPLPRSLRGAVSELTKVNDALIDIKATMRDALRARRTDAELLDLANRLAPRIGELRALRSAVVESISEGDLALLAPQTDGSQLSLHQPAA
jgi:CheY-like chemotaxis protein